MTYDSQNEITDAELQQVAGGRIGVANSAVAVRNEMAAQTMLLAKESPALLLSLTRQF